MYVRMDLRTPTYLPTHVCMYGCMYVEKFRIDSSMYLDEKMLSSPGDLEDFFAAVKAWGSVAHICIVFSQGQRPASGTQVGR